MVLTTKVTPDVLRSLGFVHERVPDDPGLEGNVLCFGIGPEHARLRLYESYGGHDWWACIAKYRTPKEAAYGAAHFDKRIGTLADLLLVCSALGVELKETDAADVLYEPLRVLAEIWKAYGEIPGVSGLDLSLRKDALDKVKTTLVNFGAMETLKPFVLVEDERLIPKMIKRLHYGQTLEFEGRKIERDLNEARGVERKEHPRFSIVPKRRRLGETRRNGYKRVELTENQAIEYLRVGTVPGKKRARK